MARERRAASSKPQTPLPRPPSPSSLPPFLPPSPPYCYTSLPLALAVSRSHALEPTIFAC